MNNYFIEILKNNITISGQYPETFFVDDHTNVVEIDSDKFLLEKFGHEDSSLDASFLFDDSEALDKEKESEFFEDLMKLSKRDLKYYTSSVGILLTNLEFQFKSKGEFEKTTLIELSMLNELTPKIIHEAFEYLIKGGFFDQELILEIGIQLITKGHVQSEVLTGFSLLSLITIDDVKEKLPNISDILELIMYLWNADDEFAYACYLWGYDELLFEKIKYDWNKAINTVDTITKRFSPLKDNVEVFLLENYRLFKNYFLFSNAIDIKKNLESNLSSKSLNNVILYLNDFGVRLMSEDRISRSSLDEWINLILSHIKNGLLSNYDYANLYVLYVALKKYNYDLANEFAEFFNNNEIKELAFNRIKSGDYSWILLAEYYNIDTIEIKKELIQEDQSLFKIVEDYLHFENNFNLLAPFIDFLNNERLDNDVVILNFAFYAYSLNNERLNEHNELIKKANNHSNTRIHNIANNIKKELNSNVKSYQETYKYQEENDNYS